MIYVVLGVVGIASLAVGFLAGLWTYANIHQHFFQKAADLADKRVAKALSAERAMQAKLRETRQKLRSQFGSDLSAKHQEIIDEEIEKVLNGGPR